MVRAGQRHHGAAGACPRDGPNRRAHQYKQQRRRERMNLAVDDALRALLSELDRPAWQK